MLEERQVSYGNQPDWHHFPNDSGDVGGKVLTSEHEKAAAKEGMESEIARLWERTCIAKEEQVSFAAQAKDLRAKIAADKGVDPRMTSARIAALREFEAYQKEVGESLIQDTKTLKRLEAQYQTAFGSPLVQ